MVDSPSMSCCPHHWKPPGSSQPRYSCCRRCSQGVCCLPNLLSCHPSDLMHVDFSTLPLSQIVSSIAPHPHPLTAEFTFCSSHRFPSCGIPPCHLPLHPSSTTHQARDPHSALQHLLSARTISRPSRHLLSNPHPQSKHDLYLGPLRP